MKPGQHQNEEGCRIFLSIFRGNIKTKDIIKVLGIKIKKKSCPPTPKLSEETKPLDREESPSNLSGKLSFLKNKGLIKKTGKRKTTKYSINYEGIIDYIIRKIILPTHFYSLGVEPQENADEIIISQNLNDDGTDKYINSYLSVLVGPQMVNFYEKNQVMKKYLEESDVYQNIISNTQVISLLKKYLKGINSMHLRLNDWLKEHSYSIENYLKSFIREIGLRRINAGARFLFFKLDRKQIKKEAIDFTIFCDICASYLGSEMHREFDFNFKLYTAKP